MEKSDKSPDSRRERFWSMLRQVMSSLLAISGVALAALNWQGQALSSFSLSPDVKLLIALSLALTIGWAAVEGRIYGSAKDRPSLMWLASLLSMGLTDLNIITAVKFGAVVLHRSHLPSNHAGFCSIGNDPCLELQRAKKADLQQDIRFEVALGLLSFLSLTVSILSVIEAITENISAKLRDMERGENERAIPLRRFGA